MIYDCFQFFNELDLLDIRLNTLDPIVDYFVITESTVTFSGKKKPLYYRDNKELFDRFNHKIIHNIIDHTPEYKGVTPFDRDSYQKSSRLDLIKDECAGDDVIIMSDLDEIPRPEKILEILNEFDHDKVYHFAQEQYYYYINMKEISGKLLSFAGEYESINDKKWLGTFMFKWKLLDLFTIEELRLNKTDEHSERVPDGGWHFTYMGGSKEDDIYDKIRHKIDSAAHQEFNNSKILNKIENNIENKKDIFGRSSKFMVVPVDVTYPKYILENIGKFNYMVSHYDETSNNDFSIFDKIRSLFKK